MCDLLLSNVPVLLLFSQTLSLFRSATDRCTPGTRDGIKAGMVLSMPTPTHADAAFGNFLGWNRPTEQTQIKNDFVLLSTTTEPLSSSVITTTAICPLGLWVGSARTQCRHTLLTVTLGRSSGCQ